MNAGDFLTEAKATIQDRGMDYGHPSDNMSRTARLWSAFLEMPIIGIYASQNYVRSVSTLSVDYLVVAGGGGGGSQVGAGDKATVPSLTPDDANQPCVEST